MRLRALRPLARLCLIPVLLLAPTLGAAAPRASAPEPTPMGDTSAGPELAARLEALRAALTELEQQRAVLQALRERETKRIAPGELPPDARYPGSVLCREGAVVYPQRPTAQARAFCAADGATP